MWVLTTHGFFSAVQKPGDAPDHVTVRARCREDIDALVARLGVPAHPTTDGLADYAWRVRVPREAWALYLVDAAMGIDYSNYKNEVGRVQGPERASVYGRVWGDLLDLDDRPESSWGSFSSDRDFPELPGIAERELGEYGRSVDLLGPPVRGKRGRGRGKRVRR